MQAIPEDLLLPTRPPHTKVSHARAARPVESPKSGGGRHRERLDESRKSWPLSADNLTREKQTKGRVHTDDSQPLSQ